MRVRVLILLIGLVLLGRSAAISAEPNETIARKPAPDPPSMELLEFIGEFGTQKDEWLDPMELEFFPIPDTEQGNGKSKN